MVKNKGENHSDFLEVCERLEWSTWTYKRNKVVAEALLMGPNIFRRELLNNATKDLKSIYKIVSPISQEPLPFVLPRNLILNRDVIRFMLQGFYTGACTGFLKGVGEESASSEASRGRGRSPQKILNLIIC